VKLFGVIALVLVLLVVVMLLFGGNHGPGRHAGGGTGQASFSGVTEAGAGGGHEPLPGGHMP